MCWSNTKHGSGFDSWAHMALTAQGTTLQRELKSQGITRNYREIPEHGSHSSRGIPKIPTRNLCLFLSAAATQAENTPNRCGRIPNDRKTGHIQSLCVHMAALLKIYLFMNSKILCAHVRRSCHGGGISPGNLTCPKQRNVATCTGSQQGHSTPSAASGDPGATASPSLISTSCLSPLQVSSSPPDPQGICKPKERSQRHSKDILNIHPKGATGTSLPAGHIPGVLQTKALPA